MGFGGYSWDGVADGLAVTVSVFSTPQAAEGTRKRLTPTGPRTCNRRQNQTDRTLVPEVAHRSAPSLSPACRPRLSLLSFTEPPGCMTAQTPAPPPIQARPGKGRRRRRPAPAAPASRRSSGIRVFAIAMCTASTLDIWPAPMPTVLSWPASTMALERTYFTTVQANINASTSGLRASGRGHFPFVAQQQAVVLADEQLVADGPEHPVVFGKPLPFQKPKIRLF